MDYTHNLKIAIITLSSKRIIQDGNIFDQIYTQFSNIIFKNKVIFMSQPTDTIICWEKKELNKIDSFFMGDLFTNAIHSDKVLYEATRVALQDIEIKLKQTYPTILQEDWRIQFHISVIIH